MVESQGARPRSVDDSEEWCAVCGAKSSGYHYGAYSCEGCKSFFKRTLQQNLKPKYECVNNDETCEVDAKTRAHCQFCRFKKCLDVGMVEEGVRKVKKRGGRSFYPLKKGKKDQETQTKVAADSEQEYFDSNSPSRQENLESAAADKFDCESDCDAETRPRYCSPLVKQLMETSPCIVPPGEPLSSTGDLILSEARKEELLTRLSNAITKELHIIVEWSKLVPGFSNLQRQDQIALLMAAGMELVVFRVIYRSIPFKEQIFMNTTSCLDRIDCYSILNQEIVDMILDVVERIRPLHVDEVEFACMEAILLLDAETPGLSGKSPVEVLRGSYMSALQCHVETGYKDQPGRFAKLLLRLPALRDVCKKGFEYFQLVRAQLEGEVPISTLLQEMFESPRI